MFDWQLILLSGAIVGDSQRVFAHAESVTEPSATAPGRSPYAELSLEIYPALPRSVLLVFPRCFDFRVRAFASVLSFAFAQAEILQRLTQTPTGIQAAENRIASDVREP